MHWRGVKNLKINLNEPYQIVYLAELLKHKDSISNVCCYYFAFNDRFESPDKSSLIFSKYLKTPIKTHLLITSNLGPTNLLPTIVNSISHAHYSLTEVSHVTGHKKSLTVVSGKLDPARLPKSDNKVQGHILLERQSLSPLSTHSTVGLGSWAHVEEPFNQWPRTNGHSQAKKKWFLHWFLVRKLTVLSINIKSNYFLKCKYVLILISFMIILHTSSKNCYVKLFKIKGILELLTAAKCVLLSGVLKCRFSLLPGFNSGHIILAQEF